MKRKGPSVPDIRDVKPTRVILDAKLTIDGGSLDTSNVGRIWGAVRVAFDRAAMAAGLGSTWTVELSCTQPKRMDARIERQKLNIDRSVPSPQTEQPVKPEERLPARMPDRFS